MPVQSGSVLVNLQKNAEKIVSPAGKTKSPSQVATRRSPRNGNQQKITTLFPSKRNRSPDGNEITPKKLKYDGDESKENSVDNITEDNKNSENLKVEEGKSCVDAAINEDDSKTFKNDEETSSKTEVDEISDTQDSPDGDNKMDDQMQIQKQDGSQQEPIENGKSENELASVQKSLPDNEKCNICSQFLNNSDLVYYQGHPQDAVEEYIALTNEKLVLASGDDGDIMERPQTNITSFSIFDEQGHLCPIDGGLVENDVRIYMSGYLKSICSDSTEIDEESVPVKDVGPIIEWFIHGFDGGNRNCITLSTEFGEYNLLKPSEQYTPLMNNLYEKIWLSKVVVEYLEEYHYLQPSYEELLEVIRESSIPELNVRRRINC